MEMTGNHFISKKKKISLELIFEIMRGIRPSKTNNTLFGYGLGPSPILFIKNSKMHRLKKIRIGIYLVLRLLPLPEETFSL